MNFFQNIKLENYRNFNYFEIDFTSGCNILIGKNGSGKTNILESISLFEKGRGLRKDNINNLINYKNDRKNFCITSIFLHDKKEINLRLFNNIKTVKSQKKLFINNNSSSESIKYFENLFSLIYFLPEMERLFLNSPSVRRDFLDRLIYSTDKNYSRLINSYKKNIFERYKILKNYSYDYDWVNTLEKKIADLGINIYKKRHKHILILNTNLKKLPSYEKYFYRILLDINDEFINDKKKDLGKLLENYLEDLKKNREFDAVFGGCKIGPHKSDIVGYNIKNNININQFSTGQQKAVILLIILAHCNFLINELKKNPIIFFDEVCSHLDLENRKLLLDLIETLNVQTFITGTEKNFFSFLSTKASYCNITKNNE